MRICILDSYYPEALASMPFDPQSTYEIELRKLLDLQFGTFDAYSKNLRSCGWTAIDIISNHKQLQEMWLRDYGFGSGDTLGSQLSFYDADVVFMQDLSIQLRYKPRLLAAQLSCPWPGDDKVRQCDVVMTSFPHYVPRIEALGVKAAYLPLAFEHTILDLFPKDLERIHDVVFIGGVGNPSHWPEGMEVLEAVAREIPTFRWWGYGRETLPSDSALHDKYMGTAFGIDMYKILLQSKIVLNRHGTVAEGFANNMRMFEATGCGAVLLTESFTNISRFFDIDECRTYRSTEWAILTIGDILDRWEYCQSTGEKGQQRTLREHTYAHRMKVVSEVLTGMLCPA